MKIKQFFALTTIYCLGFFACNSINRLYVPLGDAKNKHLALDQNVTRIYFDRQGLIYPTKHIGDQTVKNAFALLKKVYRADQGLLQQVCREEGLLPTDPNNVAQTIVELQATLIKTAITILNNKAIDHELVFLIHGFNDHPDKPANNSAVSEYEKVMQVINTQFPKRKFHYVHIFWDGMSVQNGIALLKPFNALKIWNNSQVSATYAGLELRRILSAVKSDKYYIITHSHGAGVITNALFNVIKFSADYYKDTGINGGSFIIEKYNQSEYNTPQQEIHIGMLAPAIPGNNVFSEYYDRTINGKNKVDKLAKNYHFIVGFNRYDIVTRKFYTNASWFGSTTLASRRSEINATVNLMSDPKLFDYVDFSKFNGSAQRSHSWFKYITNKPAIDNLLSDVMK